MRLFVVALFVSMAFVCCDQGPTREELAMLAAEGYYRHLLAAEYDQFLEGSSRDYAGLPEDYREQLRAAVKQFMAQQQALHRGISSVKPVRAVADTLTHSANVFLLLCYGDSTQEEIVVPMIEQQGHWAMR